MRSALYLVAVVNKRLDTSAALLAAAHAVAGLVSGVSSEEKEQLKFTNFEDANGDQFENISARSFVILGGTDGDIRRLRQALKIQNIRSVTYVSTMVGGTYIDQSIRTRNTVSENIDFYSVAFLGHPDVLGPITNELKMTQQFAPEGKPVFSESTLFASRTN